MDKVVELLPCPFCGRIDVRAFGPYGWQSQWCISHSCATFYSGTSEFAKGFATEAAAIAAWNTRALQSPSPEENEADEAYEIGKRDGYESAVQDIDLATGGDGEYRYNTLHDPDRHCPDPETMKARIVARFQSLPSPSAEAMREAAAGVAKKYAEDQFAKALRNMHDDKIKHETAIEHRAAENIAAAIRNLPIEGGSSAAGEEYMTVTLSRDGLVQSHNAFDADFDEMVWATETIIRVLQKRLSDRKFCPYSHGSALKHADLSQMKERTAIVAHLNRKMADGQAAGLKVGTLREAIEEIGWGAHLPASGLAVGGEG